MEAGDGLVKVRFNWVSLGFVTDDRHYFGGFGLHIIPRVRGGTRNHREEGRAEERLHHQVVDIYHIGKASRGHQEMVHRIALNFEDGVTRFIEARSDELVATLDYRAASQHSA